MRNAKVEAMEIVLSRHGFEVPRDVIDLALAAASLQPTSRYEVGDFVCVREGMGEVSFGTVKADTVTFRDQVMDRYLVSIFNYGLDSPEYDKTVNPEDIIELSTVERAMDYYRVRNAQS